MSKQFNVCNYIIRKDKKAHGIIKITIYSVFIERTKGNAFVTQMCIELKRN